MPVCTPPRATINQVSDDRRREIQDGVFCRIPDAMWDLLAGLPYDVINSRFLFAAVDAYAGLPVGFDVQEAIVARVRRQERETW